MAEQNNLTKIIQSLIDPCAETLRIESPKIKEATLKNGKLFINVDVKNRFSVPASSIYFLLKDVFKKIKGFDENRLWLPMSRDSIRGEIFSREGGKSMLGLVEYLTNEGEFEEARLCAIQCEILEDFRKYHPLGKKLFENSVLKAEETAKRSSSVVSTVMNLTPYTKDNNLCEILLAAHLILMAAPEALIDVSGKRLDRLVEAIQTAQENLLSNNHPTIKAYGKIMFSVYLSYQKTGK